MRKNERFAVKDTIMPTDVDVQTAACRFKKGDPVIMVKGSYEGTPGVFLNLRSDPKWADIRETDDSVREHPVEWMALSTEKRPGITPAVKSA